MNWSRDLIASALAVDALPDPARHAAVMSLWDGLAVMAAAPALEPAVRPFSDLARGPGPATLLAGGTATPAMAALANGALAHALDFEDTFDAAGLHPNAVAIPALLALAEADGATLGELLTSVAVACDAACRIGLALPSDPADHGWYHPPMIAAAGAAIGAAHMLGLDLDRAVAAVSLTLVQFSLTDGLKRSPGSDLRAVRDGFAARAVVDGVLLARAGVSGTVDPLGADGLIGQLTGSAPKAPPGAVAFLGQEVTLKAWPCCRGTHPAIATALTLRAEGVGPDQIQSAAFRITPPDDMLFEPRQDRLRPQSGIMAKFSIPYCFAWALHHGAPGLDSFQPEALKDEGVLATAAQMSMRDCAPGITPDVTLDLTDGSSRLLPLAAPPVLLAGTADTGALRAKIDQCAVHAIPAAKDLLTGLPHLPPDSRVRDLLAPLRAG